MPSFIDTDAPTMRPRLLFPSLLLVIAACNNGSSSSTYGTATYGTVTDTGGDGDGDPGDGDGDGDPCAGVDCSGNGMCIEDDGAPACDCDDGYVAFGLECVMCSAIGGSYDIDVPMATLTGSRRLNGAPAIFAAGSGLLRLENPDTGDIASFGDFPGTDQFAVEIVPGTYDIIYDAGVVIDGIPHNTHAVIEAGVDLQGGAHNVDIPMATLTGSRRLNGNPAIFVAGSGLLRLENPETGDIAGFGDFPDTDQFAVEIVPGTYDIIYDAGVVIEGIPHNTHAVIEADVDIQGGAHNINIPMATLTGSRRLNGNPAILAAGSGLLRLEDPETGDIANFGDFPDTDEFASRSSRARTTSSTTPAS